jgi:hypothetical protein
MFAIKQHHRIEVAVNSGIAAVVWFLPWRLVAGLLHR